AVQLSVQCTGAFFFSSRRRHTRLVSDWSSDVCSSDLALAIDVLGGGIDHAVGSKLERPLEQRRGEHVVYHQRRARGVSDLGDRRSEERRVGKRGRTAWGRE